MHFFFCRIYGVFDKGEPAFYLNDPTLIRQITVRNFKNFMNRKKLPAAFEDGGLLGQSLSAMDGKKWKDMRNTLAPAFTGSKIKLMFQLVTDVAQQAALFLRSLEGIEDGMDFNMRDLCTHLTNDIIASVAFGINANSLLVVKSDLNANELFQLDTSQYHKYLRLIWKENAGAYFKRLILGAMKYRMDNKVFKQDLINLLMEAKGMYVNGSNPPRNANRPNWTDSEIVAQLFSFFATGFQSTATVLCCAAHEIMENPEIQERLFEEIKEVKTFLGGKPLTYEACNRLKYMDMIISETLRKWPSNPTTTRVCTKRITFENPEGLGDFTVKVGDYFIIPIAGLHRDPKYFPNPDQFDPERFSDENKHHIEPSTYIPFGAGPRSCIAIKFALIEIKALLYYLLGDLKLNISENSTIPLVLSGEGIHPMPTNGFWIKFTKRSTDHFF